MNDYFRFPYDLAFDRNLGLITDFEQLALRAKRVAIAGMGGVGGVHLLTLARLGIGAFTIADFDLFEFANFNRQVGAVVMTVGRGKTAVLEEMALAINPELRIRRCDAGVTPDSVDDFLRDADLFVDGLDFFALPIRRRVFARCAELGIPAVTAAPVGMGSAFIAFLPGGMSFEEYFRLDGHSEQEQYLRFGLGISPHAMARGYLVQPERFDLARHRAPSTVAACQLCAGVIAVAAVKLLLGRGNVRPAPYNHQFDPYRGRYFVTKLPFGNAGLLQRLKIAIGRRLYRRQLATTPSDPPASGRSPVDEILNLARWAPSGDNSQPWEFMSTSDPETVLIRIRHDPNSVYEYRRGEPTWLSAGILIETARIAATAWQRDMVWEQETPSAPETISLRFSRANTITTDPLTSFVTLRSVDRRSYRRRALTGWEKATLQNCVTDELVLDWHEGALNLWRAAQVAAAATGIRLRCPEAFPIHRQVIDWNHALSRSGIPARAVGLWRPALPLMRWAMGKWERTKWLNRLDGTMIAALQMDLLPGLRSAAWFVMRRPPGNSGEAATPKELLEIGRGIQRFWLTATRLGLAIQPTLATIAFAHYGEHQLQFSSESGLSNRAEKLAKSFNQAFGVKAQEVVFVGRIGEPYPRLLTHRSVRRPLDELMN